MSEKNLATKLRYTDQELGIIKNSFAGHIDLMVLFRKFLLQGDMSEEEQKMLDGFVSSQSVKDILAKAINPKLDKLAPPFQTVDLFSNLNFEPTPYEHANHVFKGRNFAVRYLDERFLVLNGGDVDGGIDFDSLVIPVEDKEQTMINILARNFLLSHIDTQLFNSLMIIAGEKEETPEQQKKRLTMNSSK